MAVIGVAVSYAVYQTFQRLARSQKWGIFVGGFVAAWLSIEIAALAAALELALSGTSPANIAVLAMGGIHALIGIGEGLITVGALAFIYASRPDLLDSQNKRQGSSALVWIVGLLIAVALTVLSPLASAHPDGLEWVAKQNGFLQSARNPAYNIIPDYILPGISNEALATILAGIIGVLLVFGSALAIAYLRRTRQSTH
jgi:cobalt/nickel transport system permease protein